MTIMSDVLWPGSTRAGTRFDDAHIVDAMLRVESAWSTGLVEAGIAPPAARTDLDVLRSAIGTEDLGHLAATAEASGTPVVGLVEMLRQRLPDTTAAQWLHRGLTSQDVVDTALLWCAAEAIDAIDQHMARLTADLSRLAHEHRRTVMVARTLTQHAVPTTFGLKCAVWLAGVTDARTGLARLTFPAQLGGAAGTMAAAVELASDAAEPGVAVMHALHRTADILGLDFALPWHTHRAPVTRCADAVVTCSDAWGRIANDVLSMTRPETGELSEGTGGGSSTMPHKANPILSILVRRAALTAPHAAAILHTAAADAVDERTPGSWHTEWDALATLLRRSVIAGGQTADLIGSLQVRTDRMQRNYDSALDSITSEQRSMAHLTGRTPQENYLGLNDVYIDAHLARSKEGPTRT